jgi:hypothetical protein
VVFHTQVAWIPHLLFLSVAPTSIISGFLIPLTLLSLFFFPSSCWVAFGFLNCTVCTSNILVGGVAKIVVWLATMCCIENCCNCFVSCSVGFVFVEPTIPSACGPTLYLVLSSIERGISGKISYNKRDQE